MDFEVMVFNLNIGFVFMNNKKYLKVCDKFFFLWKKIRNLKELSFLIDVFL